jgi:hypothetical protein
VSRLWMVGVVLGLSLAGCPEESGSDTEEGERDAQAGSPEAGGGAAGGGSDAGASDAGAADPAKKVGTFTIKLTAPTPASGGSAASEGYTSITGKVFDRPVPEEVIWEVDQQSGGCKLLKPRVPFCEKPCTNAVCVEDDQCAPNAEAQSVGKVTISGLRQKAGTADIGIDPLGESVNARVYSTPGEVELPYPAFAEGDEIKLQAAGSAAFPGFSTAAKGIAPLELTTTAFPLKMNSALTLAWKAATKPDLARIGVDLDISHHGGTKGMIECDVADTGSLEIPAALVTRLLALGVAGFPTIKVTRSSKGTAQTAKGGVDLQVLEEVEKAVQIDGLVSCSGPSDCPAGKTCQADLSCK